MKVNYSKAEYLCVTQKELKWNDENPGSRDEEGGRP